MQNTDITFTIVTPSLNQGAYLESTINSVISQEGDFFIDYIVMDGGSTDESVQILQRYDALLKSGQYSVKCKGVNFSWTAKKDEGQYDAINKGFSLSSGQIMGWINSDDVQLPSALKTVSMVFRRFPSVEWITAHSTRIDNEGSIIDVDTTTLYPQSLIQKGVFNGKDGPFIQQESTFWKRTLWDRLDKKLDVTYRYAADYELWTRFATLTELVKVKTQLGAFRKHIGQKTALVTAYHDETDLILKVGFYDRVCSKTIRYLSKIPLLNKYCLLNNNAYTVYFSERDDEWVIEKVKGRVR